MIILNGMKTIVQICDHMVFQWREPEIRDFCKHACVHWKPEQIKRLKSSALTATSPGFLQNVRHSVPMRRTSRNGFLSVLCEGVHLNCRESELSLRTNKPEQRCHGRPKDMSTDVRVPASRLSLSL